MTIKSTIVDAWGTGTEACVTERGQLVVAPLAYSLPYNVKAELVNTGYNLVTPKTGKRFVVTDIILTANKNVGASDATVDLYEATSATDTTVAKGILNIEMIKNSSLTLNGLNMIVSEGVWVNVKTDDDDVFATVMGYYVSA